MMQRLLYCDEGESPKSRIIDLSNVSVRGQKFCNTKIATENLTKMKDPY